MLISNEEDFSTRNITNNERYFLMMEESIHQEDIILMYIHPTTELQKYIKQKLTTEKGETDKSTITIGDINALFSLIDRIDK